MNIFLRIISNEKGDLLRCLLNFNFIIIIMFTISWNSFAQDLMTLDFEPTCNTANIDMIHVTLNQDELENIYPLPYLLEWENLSNGEVGEINMLDYNYTLESLSAGIYEITVNLSDDCFLSSQGEIEILSSPCFESINHDIMPASGPLIISDGGVIVEHNDGGTAPFQIKWHGGMALPAEALADLYKKKKS